MKGRTDLGHVTVNGLILVPYPPTKIKAFIIFRLISYKSMDRYRFFVEQYVIWNSILFHLIRVYQPSKLQMPLFFWNKCQYVICILVLLFHTKHERVNLHLCFFFLCTFSIGTLPNDGYRKLLHNGVCHYCFRFFRYGTTIYDGF